MNATCTFARIVDNIILSFFWEELSRTKILTLQVHHKFWDIHNIKHNPRLPLLPPQPGTAGLLTLQRGTAAYRTITDLLSLFQ